ncbi:HK97 family phage prohead protease [Heyndrickxia ginsengihumi]|uniref:HK97 family phage prohead protease n=1 Tax=Heyndrickxia ginsengihumi TaxID=363870 RepID=UPI000471F9E3|nr:HK97 family phage prohead protease [Heyndrickxia ginsengihumi]
MDKIEKRYLDVTNLETRADDVTDQKIIEGYALKFNSWSNDLGGFIEVIDPEALKQTDMTDVRALIDHDPSKVIGRTLAETLELNVDEVGLHFRCVLPNTSYANDLYENIRQGNITQCSFGFILAPDGDKWEKDNKSDVYKRTLTNIESLFDVSVVTYPAYNSSEVSVAARSLNKLKEQEMETRKQQLLLKLKLDKDLFEVID